MEGTAFSIDEGSFDASLIPEGSRTPGTEEFQRAVNYLGLAEKPTSIALQLIPVAISR